VNFKEMNGRLRKEDLLSNRVKVPTHKHHPEDVSIAISYSVFRANSQMRDDIEEGLVWET
jgi:hypothetical protein